MPWRRALASVPHPSTVGAPGEPGIARLVPGIDGGFSAAATGAGPGSALFVEAPEGWAYEVGTPRQDGAGLVFPVKRVDHPAGADRPSAPLTLTLGRPGRRDRGFREALKRGDPAHQPCRRPGGVSHAPRGGPARLRCARRHMTL